MSWEEKSYSIQVSMFFLTAFSVVLSFFATNFAFFAFLDALPKRQPPIEMNTVRAIEVFSYPSEGADISYQSEPHDRTAELAALNAGQLSKRFKKQTLRGSLIRQQRNLVFTPSQIKVRSSKRKESPSIIRFTSNSS